MNSYRRYFNRLNNPVFITAVTKNRQHLLMENIELLREAFKVSIKKFSYKFIAGIILPEHFHIIISTENTADIPFIIKEIKYNFTKNLPEKYKNKVILTESEKKRREKGIWQRRYYDHIIRDENDFNKHLDYIHYNSVKHYDVKPADWKFSSFNKFAEQGYYEKNWCNFEDKNNIKQLNFE